MAKKEGMASMSTSVAVYEDGKKAEANYALSEVHGAIQDHRAVVWVSLLEPSKEELDSVAQQFGWQELAREDADRLTSPRPPTAPAPRRRSTGRAW